MYILVVVDNPRHWPLDIQNVEVVQARKYITEPAFTRIGDARVFNLCRSYRYQSTGYYVSLLAAARGHKPIPDVSTIRDLQFPTIVRLASETLEEEIEKCLAGHKGRTFALSIYFGRNLAKRYDRLSMELFNLFRAPLLRAHFAKEDGKWRLQSVGPIAVSEVPESHHAFIVIVASDFFRGRHRRIRPRTQAAFSMAILTNPKDRSAPSNERALEKFIEAADRAGIDAELIDRDAYSRLPEYDALFIRETTSVTNHTYLPVRPPRRGGRTGRDRRFVLDPEMHEQGLSGGIADPPPHPHAEIDHRTPRQPRSAALRDRLSVDPQAAGFLLFRRRDQDQQPR